MATKLPQRECACASKVIGNVEAAGHKDVRASAERHAFGQFEQRTRRCSPHDAGNNRRIIEPRREIGAGQNEIQALDLSRLGPPHRHESRTANPIAQLIFQKRGHTEIVDLYFVTSILGFLS